MIFLQPCMEEVTLSYKELCRGLGDVYDDKSSRLLMYIFSIIFFGRIEFTEQIFS